MKLISRNALMEKGKITIGDFVKIIISEVIRIPGHFCGCLCVGVIAKKMELTARTLTKNGFCFAECLFPSTYRIKLQFARHLSVRFLLLRGFDKEGAGAHRVDSFPIPFCKRRRARRAQVHIFV